MSLPGLPTLPSDYPNKKREFGHRGSPTSLGLLPETQKTALMSSATSTRQRLLFRRRLHCIVYAL